MFREQLKAAVEWLRTYGKTVAITVLIVFLFRWQVAEPFYIPSQSMEPTLAPGDRILVFKLTKKPERWDVIVFRNPDNPSQNFIKRVVGLPNEILQIKDGQIYINGTKLEKPDYIKSVFYTDSGENGILEPVKIKPGHYFVLGDNSSHSNDSRSWHFIFVGEDAVVGKAFSVLWPLNRIGRIK